MTGQQNFRHSTHEPLSSAQLSSAQLRPTPRSAPPRQSILLHFPPFGHSSSSKDSVRNGGENKNAPNANREFRRLVIKKAWGQAQQTSKWASSKCAIRQNPRSHLGLPRNPSGGNRAPESTRPSRPEPKNSRRPRRRIKNPRPPHEQSSRELGEPQESQNPNSRRIAAAAETRRKSGAGAARPKDTPSSRKP